MRVLEVADVVFVKSKIRTIKEKTLDEFVRVRGGVYYC
jgi:hypothetical protein